jgi:dethiobiotin synthetase
MVDTFHRFGPGAGVVEGAGGLFVPLDERHDVIDAIGALKLPVVLVARAGLGTINHTSLSLEALARRRARVAAVVLVKSTRGRDPSERLNRDELERRWPSLRFFGPCPFSASVQRRDLVLRRLLAPLVPPA